jgi:hypothetical protein
MSKPLRKEEMLKQSIGPRADTDNELKFRKDTSVEIHTSDKKMLDGFKNRFLLGKETIPNLRILMVNTGTNVSVQEVFPDSKITYIEEGRGGAKRLARVGLDAHKADFRREKSRDLDFGEKDAHDGFDVVVILDPDAEPTPGFLTNIKGEGWILCRARMAGALRATGDYEVMGVIDKNGGVGPTLAKGTHGEMWGEVTDDKEFKAAKETPGVATYDDAEKALTDAEMRVREGHVLSDYRKLLEESTRSAGLKGIPWKDGDESKNYVLRKSGKFAH